jgi:hypothetical protein
MVLSYAHADGDYLKSAGKECRLIRFLRYAAESYGLEFWWDEDMAHSRFDAEIRRQFSEAKVIVLLISIDFLRSEYIKSVERKIAARRQSREDVIVVPIMLGPIPGGLDRYPWLKKLHRPPTTKPYLIGKGNQTEFANEIAEHIMQRLKRYKERGYRETPALRTLRQRRDERFTDKERARLKKDACEKAKEFVPVHNVREQIRDAAQLLIEKSGGKWLSKPQLESLDKRFLLGKSRRSKPDAKHIRWVLRCYGLHPQGRG